MGVVMSKTAEKPDTSKDAKAKKPLVPPEETFWQRYSAHHEAPLSGLTSVAVHVLAIPLLLLITWLIVKLGLGEDTKPLPVDTVQLLGGGGGSPRGTDKGGSDPGSEPIKDAESGTAKDKSNPPPPEEEPRRPLTPTAAKALEAEFDNDAAVKRWVQDPTKQFDSLAHREQEQRTNIRKTVNPGVGQGGAGTGGGKDTGTDKSVGGGKGPGKASLNQREKRILRWHMTFNTRNGVDYASQLRGLGAVVALPTKDPKVFNVIEDLSQRPPQMKEQTVADIDKIFWVDDVKESVYSLLHNGLGLKELPPFFVAFFPKELEEKLLTIELDYQQQKTGQKNEDVIHETKFNVVRKGAGYDVTVANQKYIK